MIANVTLVDFLPFIILPMFVLSGLLGALIAEIIVREFCESRNIPKPAFGIIYEYCARRVKKDKDEIKKQSVL